MSMPDSLHSFHIPVMGTGFTIDTPVRVAPLGISSVISLVDDALIEQIRKFYCEKYNMEYAAITKNTDDYRAKRITAYLNLVDEIVKIEFSAVKNSDYESGSRISKYFELLPQPSPLKMDYEAMLCEPDENKKKNLQEALREQMVPGSIDVNIMTKLDRTNYSTSGDKLSAEYSDALSALRGFAESTLNAAIVFSAGINKRLYTYVEKFEDFYADASGFTKKQIVLKVSDYRSSIIQGRVFARRGLWVSEYRVESGLNCGGHAFLSNGQLLGPILEEFKTKRQELVSGLQNNYTEALKKINRPIPEKLPRVRFTVQGGVGTAEEHEFLQSHYDMQSIGWGSPFLLVPEAVHIDTVTLKQLAEAGEDDLYVSEVSPLNIPFNNLVDSASDQKKLERFNDRHPGSPCVKGHLKFNTDFTKKPICIASREYQELKIKQLENEIDNPEELEEAIFKVVEKSCLCHDLGASSLLANSIGREEKLYPAICPGPNLAYFNKVFTIKEMVDHIYGRLDLLKDMERPNLFIKELKMYLDHFITEIKKFALDPTEKKMASLNAFRINLLEGIDYYRDLFPYMFKGKKGLCIKAVGELQELKQRLIEYAFP